MPSENFFGMTEASRENKRNLENAKFGHELSLS